MLKFLVMDIDPGSENRNRILPFILDAPPDVKAPEPSAAKGIVTKSILEGLSERNWRWGKKFVLSEKDAENSPEIDRMFKFVDWERVTPMWLARPTNYLSAYEYVKLVGPAPSAEEFIAQDTCCSYKYAMEILGGRFPKGEEAIGKDPLKSVNYAKMAKCRIPPAENEISKNEELSIRYGKIMKEYSLWASWTEEDISRTPVWMYQYAKDHLGESLPDRLHNTMHMLSLCESNNKWIRKYLGSKKYMSKKNGRAG